MRGAMPEATVLYSVTSVVVTGLVLWVLFVLKTAKEPWSRPPLTVPAAELVSAPHRDRSSDDALPSAPEALSGAPTLNADSTARATPVALASDGAPKSKPGDDPAA